MAKRTGADVEKSLQKQQEREAIQDERGDIQYAEGSYQGDSEREVEEVLPEPEPEPEEIEDSREGTAQVLLAAQRKRRDADVIRQKVEEGGIVSGSELSTLNEVNEELGLDLVSLNGAQLDNSEQDHQFPVDNSGEEFEQPVDNDVNLNKPGFHGDTVVLKVDGQLVRMPANQALSLLQKSQSADRRLEQVALKEQQLAQREAALQQTQFQPPAPGVDNLSSADVEKDALEYTRLVEDGEDEAAAKILARMVSSSQRQVDPSQTVAQVKAELIKEEASNVESRLKNSGKYDDVFGDPTAMSLAVKNVASLRAKGYQGSLEDLMVEGMEMVRDWKTGKPRQQRLAPRQDDKKRTQRKQTMPKTVRGGSSAQRPKKAVAPELTEAQKRQAAFSKMKEGRNQR